MDAKTFGTFVAECRKRKNMTQADLATKLNVTDKAVSRWERGVGFPDISIIEPLASALEISVLELMKSERIISNEIQKKLTGLMRILIVLFAGTSILYTLGKEDKTLQTICIVGLLAIAMILSLTIWKQKDHKQMRYAASQALYCGITAWTAFGLSRFVGNIVTSILIIAVTTLYIRFLSDKSAV